MSWGAGARRRRRIERAEVRAQRARTHTRLAPDIAGLAIRYSTVTVTRWTTLLA
jgi:hypothetical protein